MKLKIAHQIRTNNFNDKQMLDKITKLWREASEKINDQDIIKYGVYFDYQADYKGDYSLAVGIEAEDGDLEIPERLNFKVFQVDKADEMGIVNTWAEIWKLEDKQSLERAYTFDFEKYYPNGDVEIYIALQDIGNETL